MLGLTAAQGPRMDFTLRAWMQYSPHAFVLAGSPVLTCRYVQNIPFCPFTGLRIPHCPPNVNAFVVEDNFIERLAIMTPCCGQCGQFAEEPLFWDCGGLPLLSCKAARRVLVGQMPLHPVKKHKPPENPPEHNTVKATEHTGGNLAMLLDELAQGVSPVWVRLACGNYISAREKRHAASSLWLRLCRDGLKDSGPVER